MVKIKKILILNNNNVYNLFLLPLSFEYELVTITNIDEGFRLLSNKENRFSIILGDYELFSSESINLFNNFKLPIVLFGKDEDLAKAINLGADDVITNTTNIIIIKNRINNLIKLYEAIEVDDKISEDKTIKNNDYDDKYYGQKLADDSTTLIYVGDEKTFDLLYVNKEIAKISGKTIEEAKGKKCYEYLRNLNYPCPNCRLQQANRNYYLEEEYDDQVSGHHYLTKGKLIDWNGKKAFVRYLFDETDRYNSQKSLIDLIDGIPNGIGIHHFYSNGIVEMVYFNDGYYSLIESKRNERNILVNGIAIGSIHPDDEKTFMGELIICNAGNGVSSCDVRIMTGNGKYKWINIKNRVAYKTIDKTVMYASYSDVDKERIASMNLEASYRAMGVASVNAKIEFWMYYIDENKLQHIQYQNESNLGYPTIIENYPECLYQSNIVEPSDQEISRKMFKDLKNGAKSSEATIRVLNKKTNKYEWYRIIYTRLENKKDNQRIAICFAINADLQQESIALYEHELQLRYEMMRDAIMYYEINLTTGVIEEYVSKFTNDESIQAPIPITEDSRKIILKNIVEEDRDIVRNNLFSEALLKRYKVEKTSFEVCYRRFVGNNTIHWVKSYVSIMKRPRANDIIAFIYTNDVDDEKNKELALNSILDEEIESAILINVKSGILRIIKKKNDQIDNIKDGDNFDESIAKFINHILYFDDRENARKVLNLNYLISELKKNPRITLAFQFQDYESLITYKQVVAFYLDNSYENIVLSKRDITEMYEEEQRQKQALMEAFEEANEANQAKSEFLSRMSHDMRTPLNAIIGLVYLSLSESNLDIIYKHLRNIDISSHILLGLINDVLDLGKVESGKIELKDDVLSLKEFLENINIVIGPLLESKDIAFNCNIDVGYENIIVDKLRFSQVFINLLTNSAKYTSQGGKVDFLAERIDSKNDKHGIRFIVRDNGRGMSKEFIKIAFDPFTQENAYLNDINGTGLGLAIVKSLVNVMGGTIQVKSELGEGTEFIIDLYFKIMNNNEIVELKKEIDYHYLKGLRVLVVDDNVMNLMIASSILEEKGCLVDTAIDGNMAVDKFASSKDDYYDLILMDIRMPIMDGIEATQKIRSLKKKDAKTVLIIAVTADALVNDREKSIHSGMNGFVLKPIEPESLYETIIELIQKDFN